MMIKIVGCLEDTSRFLSCINNNLNKRQDTRCNFDLVSIFVYYNGAGALLREDMTVSIIQHCHLVAQDGSVQVDLIKVKVRLFPLTLCSCIVMKIYELYELYKVRTKLKYPIVGVHPSNNW